MAKALLLFRRRIRDPGRKDQQLGLALGVVVDRVELLARHPHRGLRADLEDVVTDLEGDGPGFLATPQFVDDRLSIELGREILVKVETLNPIGSFKGRGTGLLAQELDPALTWVCATAGNFGQGLAYAARDRVGYSACAAAAWASIGVARRIRPSSAAAATIPSAANATAAANHEVPPKVEYSLTPLGVSLNEALLPLGEWGERHMKRIEAVHRPPKPDGETGGRGATSTAAPV